ncbi:MAG: 5'-nucleotidase, partial [Candidatus Sumerlaeota bacterium]|nr:5'-nucleotidase [Candidatus Sumerlaeota bacterium]
EKKWYPEVQTPIAQAPKGLSGSAAEGGMGQAGVWLGHAILAKMNADVVLFHREFFRKGIPAGPVTSDDLYKMMQPRYAKTLTTLEATGEQLLKLLELTMGERGEHIVGAKVKVDKSKPAGRRIVQSDIDPARTYKVVVLDSHIHPVAKHPYGITDELKAMGIQWTETKQTILGAAVDCAKEQKTIVAPTDAAE